MIDEEFDKFNQKSLRQVNFEKLKEKMYLVLETNRGQEPIGDKYDIEEHLISWALTNISMKKLKELIKRSEVRNESKKNSIQK